MATTPVVYFIDDSATMREVIKIAFRRENLNVVACHDADSAMGLMEQTAPDVVISDVIMPDKDGYDVCNYIKQHPKFGNTPVILMSGVVNKAVAERAFAVKADELIRKPFQPQDLIGRVRHLLNPKAAVPQISSEQAAASAAALSSIFAAASGGARPAAAPIAAAPRPVAVPSIAATAAAAMSPAVPAPPVSIPGAQASAAPAPAPAQAAAPAPVLVPPAQPVPAPTPAPVAAAQDRPAAAATRAPQSKVPAPPASSALGDSTKTRLELLRLQSQIKKLESELEAEREYSRALEEHIKTLQETD